MILSLQEISQIQAHITKTTKPDLLNTLLRTLTIFKTSPEKILRVYNQMLLSPSHHDHFTIIYALKACAFAASPFTQKGREVHARALKSGHLSDLFVQNSLLVFYSVAGLASECCSVFSEISSPDVVSWTSLVSALSKNGHPAAALLTFASMDVEPNEFTIVSALAACSGLKDGKLGKGLHGIYLRRFGCHGLNLVLDNALLDMYSKCCSFNYAVQLFDIMTHRDVVSGTTMICGYVQDGRHVEAISLFMELVRKGKMVPNEVTVTCVLKACASNGFLSSGKWLHSFSLRTSIDVNGVVGNSLIHMYSNCGAIETALKIFAGLSCRDLVSWCTIIRGMSTNGNPKAALQMFSQMLCFGCQPDSVAFLAALSGCCYGGFIEEGSMFFRAMYEVYDILPEKEHYTCLIDAYGRAGCLKEAEDFLNSMPMSPDRAVWGALLSSCRTNGADEAVCNRIRMRILRAGTILGGGTYALLSNMLAGSEKWDESNNVREQIDIKKIHKLAGCSWTELA